MEGRIDKRSLLDQLKGELTTELDRATRRARDSAEAATHEENRAESDKDMRSTEASYVARGQAARVSELERNLVQLGAMVLEELGPGDPIRASAIVVVDQDAPRKGRTTYFLVTAAGGVHLACGGVEVVTLTTASPLGAALIGLSLGDEVEVPTPQGKREYTIVEVR